jgi:TPR repeat protein
VALFRAAADQGVAEAAHSLGVMYSSGLDLARDDVSAAKWYRQAAEAGYAEAQNNLCAMYSAGRGVPRDYVEALMWCDLAAKQDNQTAQRSREYITKRMTPQQIAEAEQRAREWKPKQ